MSPAIETLEKLLSHAHAIESEAVERYSELAEAMDVHNHPGVATLFRKMASIEEKHVDKVQALANGVEISRLPPWDYRWQEPESPERVPMGEEHYQMTPREALSLMLACEKRAFAFFASVAEETNNAAVRSIATQLADEERHHAELLCEWLTRFPESEDKRYEDLDEPVDQE